MCKRANKIAYLIAVLVRVRLFSKPTAETRNNKITGDSASTMPLDETFVRIGIGCEPSPTSLLDLPMFVVCLNQITVNRTEEDGMTSHLAMDNSLIHRFLY